MTTRFTPFELMEMVSAEDHASTYNPNAEMRAISLNYAREIASINVSNVKFAKAHSEILPNAKAFLDYLSPGTDGSNERVTALGQAHLTHKVPPTSISAADVIATARQFETFLKTGAR